MAPRKAKVSATSAAAIACTVQELSMWGVIAEGSPASAISALIEFAGIEPVRQKMVHGRPVPAYCPDQLRAAARAVAVCGEHDYEPGGLVWLHDQGCWSSCSACRSRSRDRGLVTAA